MENDVRLAQLALLGDHYAQKRVTKDRIILPCPGCGSHNVNIRCSQTKAEIVCQNRSCGFRIIKSCKSGSEQALIRALEAWNTRIQLFTIDELETFKSPSDWMEDI